MHSTFHVHLREDFRGTTEAEWGIEYPVRGVTRPAPRLAHFDDDAIQDLERGRDVLIRVRSFERDDAPVPLFEHEESLVTTG
jgi:hypothetical protein